MQKKGQKICINLTILNITFYGEIWKSVGKLKED